MHGLVFIFLKGRERVEYLLTLLIVAVLALLTSGKPHRSFVDGREVVEPVILGHVLPEWLLLVVLLPIVSGVLTAVRAFLNRFWPPKEDLREDQSEWTYIPAPSHPHNSWRLWTAREYLLADPPCGLASGFEGLDWEEEYRQYAEETDGWLREASAEMLESLVEEVRHLAKPLSFDTRFNLIAAYDERGVPSLDQIAALAEEIGDPELIKEVEERRSEPPT